MGSRKQSAQIRGYQFAETKRTSKGQSVSILLEVLVSIFLIELQSNNHISKEVSEFGANKKAFKKC